MEVFKLATRVHADESEAANQEHPSQYPLYLPFGHINPEFLLMQHVILPRISYKLIG